MEEKIIPFIEKHGLLAVGDRVMVAVSGGPDSLALLHFLVQNRKRWQLDILAVHLNHQFRGKEADEDEQVVGELCQKWGIPYISKRMDVAGFAKTHKLGKQVAARECRYQFFEEVAKREGYAKVALGHHADDQIETVLMRLVRGSGLAGLCGIPIVRETASYTVIRPLLPVSKAEIEAYCQRHHLEPRRDVSNDSDEYTRNYVRHHLLPHLVHLNPNIHQVISDMTATLQEENEYIEKETRKFLKEVIEEERKEALTISLSSFLNVPLPLQRRLILLLLSYLPVSLKDWGKVHIDSLLKLFHSKEGNKQLHLPNQVVVTKAYQQAHFRRQPVKAKEELAYQLELPSPGEYALVLPKLQVQLTELSVKEKTSLILKKELANLAEPCYIALFDIDKLKWPLLLRNRRPGDRIQPLGMAGHQKVKDIFINEKIPQAARTTWPLLADRERILWLPGLKRSNWAQVTADTQRILKVKINVFEEDLLRAGRFAGNYHHGRSIEPKD